MFLLVILGYIILVVFEFIPLTKQKLWHDFWVNTVLTVFSFTIAILLSLGVMLPSPEKPIRDLITSVFGK